MTSQVISRSLTADLPAVAHSPLTMKMMHEKASEFVILGN